MLSLTKFRKISSLNPVNVRTLVGQSIDKNFYLCTDKPRKVDFNKSLRLNQDGEKPKPLVLMISWLGSQPNQIHKYCQLYTDKGLDVLIARVTIYQLLLSMKSFEIFATKVAEILHVNRQDYPEIFLHSFSVGAGIWGVIRRMMLKNPSRYGEIPQRIIGQIWDSPTHYSQTITGTPVSMFPHNFFLRSLVFGTLWLLLTFHPTTVPNLRDSIDSFKFNVVPAPALFIGSKTDIIGIPEFSKACIEIWKDKGVDVTYNCFEKSGHVMHFKTYPVEYLKLVEDHWKKVKLLDRK